METSSFQHFGFQPEELADEFNQSTVELLSNALNAMRSKVGGFSKFILLLSAKKIAYLILNFKLLEKQPNLGEEEVQKSFERLQQIYSEKVSALLKAGSV